MFEGLKNLANSEKAIVGGSLVIAATVLVALGRMSITDWQSYTQVIFVGYVGTKTVQGVASMWTDAKRPIDKTTTSTEVTKTTDAETQTIKIEEKTEEKKA